MLGRAADQLDSSSHRITERRATQRKMLNSRRIHLALAIMLLLVQLGGQPGSCNRIKRVVSRVRSRIAGDRMRGLPTNFSGRDAEGASESSRSQSSSSSSNANDEQQPDEQQSVAKSVQRIPSISVLGGETTIKSDYETQCFVNRGSSLRKAPKLFFFSHKYHSNDTLGCMPLKKIPIQLRETGGDIEDDPDEWLLDTIGFKEELIDTGDYDGSLPTYLMIHGFLASWNSSTWMCKLKDDILNATDANVFIVDWSGGAKPMLPIDYGSAVSNTKYVGAMLAKFIVTLLRLSNQTDASRFHLIGHSLGAHISGLIGYSLTDQNQLGRITGLDPAGPCFSASNGAQERARLTGEMSDGRRRLSPMSAKLVVAIHTDTGKFGLNENCGHYDVYVNGGRHQPGCVGQSVFDRVDSLFDFRIGDAINLADITCAHSFAHNLPDVYSPATDLIAKHHHHLLHNRHHFLWGRHNQRPAEQCHLMAYRCPSWLAFRKGECGVSASRDPSRVFDILRLDPRRDSTTLREAAELAEEKFNERLGPHDQSDDDENDEQINDEQTEESQNDLFPEQNALKSANREWQHFLKTGRAGETPTVCAFTYQVVIAAEPGEQPFGKKLYLDIPLFDQAGLIDSKGKKVSNRLAQISHNLEANSWTRRQMAGVFERLGEQNATQLDYSTALLTFDAASSDECRALINSETPSTMRKHWYLCSPLANIDGVRLYSPDEETLQRIKWVTLAYLSGPDRQSRADGSFVFEPDMDAIERGQVNKDDFKKENRPRRRGIKRLLGGLKSRAKCLLNNINPLQDSESSCRYKSVKVEHMMPLRMVSRGSKLFEI